MDTPGCDTKELFGENGKTPWDWSAGDSVLLRRLHNGRRRDESLTKRGKVVRRWFSKDNNRPLRAKRRDARRGVVTAAKRRGSSRCRWAPEEAVFSGRNLEGFSPSPEISEYSS